VALTDHEPPAPGLSREVIRITPTRIVSSGLGDTLIKPIAALTDWARENGEAIVDFQERNGPAGVTATAAFAPR
jgi:glycerol dehydrogenase-like iron-containing ADH family enzyme